VTVSNDENNQQKLPDKQVETTSITDNDENIDELNESLQDLIIEYRIQEQQKNSELNQENDDDDDDDGDNDNDDVNLQRILKQIGVSLHNKYRQKTNVDQSSTKLSNMIQQLYQTLKKTQPQLFKKSSQTDKTSTDDKQSIKVTNANQDIEGDENDDEEEIVEEEEEEEEEIFPLTPEMEHANTIFDQANKLINVTLNRQYEA
jgi:hypothetical protein